MLIRRRCGDGEVVIDPDAADGPAILHWGTPIPGTDIDEEQFRRAGRMPVVVGGPDVVPPIGLVPSHAGAHPGRPGLLGHRPDGTAWSPRFRTVEVDTDGEDGIVLHTVDPVAGLQLDLTVHCGDVLETVATLTNLDDTNAYVLDALAVTLPVPSRAGELLTFSGRWADEFHPDRRPWGRGLSGWENRRGRTSHQHPPLVFAGTDGFGEHDGEVWAAHLAWSGNHRGTFERLSDGRRSLQLGELLHPGELVLDPGESYSSPSVLASFSDAGLTGASQGFHRFFRSRETHPSTPRKVLVNTWEAVYFDHDAARLRALADRAARVGAERFVLDDGWFGSRRDDTSGLGDWVVSADAHPDGLGPLIEHVRSLDMEFGLWVEPEMVNRDSELFRAHPDWALTTDGYDAIEGRHQLVLDLARPEAFDHVYGQLDRLLADHDIGFVKWDMNRDHIGGSDADERAGTHRQTLALYRLLDELRERHPEVEFETCASGGGRIDAGILARTDRVWTSDCNDPLDRQRIQRGVSTLLPPELMGAHIGGPHSHTTGRRHPLPFRGATAFFGHLGIEWNLVDVPEHELDALAEIVALHKRHRPLLHSGDAVRFDTESSAAAHGVISRDRSEAIVSFAVLETTVELTPRPVRIVGLDPGRRYRIEQLPLPWAHPGMQHPGESWVEDGIELSGAHLAGIGVQPPALLPETAILFHLRAVD